MKERSRIRFNPATQEIEIEGSEAFVRSYFQKLQGLLLKSPEEKSEKPSQKKTRPVGIAKTTAKFGGKKIAKVTKMDAVIELVRGSKEGITTSDVKEKTGLKERQIWSIVYQAEKKGKIKKTKRGVYVAA